MGDGLVMWFDAVYCLLSFLSWLLSLSRMCNFVMIIGLEVDWEDVDSVRFAHLITPVS